MNNVLFKPSNTDDENAPDYADAGGSYTPVDGDSQTLLLIVDTANAAKSRTATCFVIIKTLPTKRELMILTLPGDTYAAVGGTGNTIYEYYRTEGALSAAKAVESSIGLAVDKYLKVNRDGLETLINIFGGVDYDIPYNLVYEEPGGEDIIIREGRSYLDADSIRKLITFPAYRSGEQYRAATTSQVAAELINKNVSAGFSERIDGYFNTVINSGVETNITAYDYAEKAAAIKYIAESKDKIANVIRPSGDYDENGYFILEPNFVQAVDSLYS
jgi:anionic cell wall polymer biosynthesis LytR-Cps2A-Psr (LCP) family protein